MSDDASAPTSIKARISALNLEQVGAIPGAPAPYSYESVATKKKRPPPPPPPGQRPDPALRSQSTNNPPVLNNGTTTSRPIGNQPNIAVSSDTPTVIVPRPRSPAAVPALPPRPSRSNGAKPPPPSLPPRRPSESPSLGGRKPSMESISSTISARSSVSAMSTRTSASVASTANGGRQFEIKAPAYDPSKLPPLPAKREKKEEEEKKPKYGRLPLRPTKSSPNTVSATVDNARTVKAPLPAPNIKKDAPHENTNDTPPSLPARPSLPQRPGTRPVRSALEFGMNKSTERATAIPSRQSSTTTNEVSNGSPPPVPHSSRPDLTAILASKPKPGAIPQSCLKCRDFSAADQHAARFPRHSIPSTDLGWLAHQLTAPFSSHTDKARTIFTWLHHNIEYDVNAFFNNNVKPSTPNSTLQTGLAVCEGYAGLFTALATKAGLESIVVGGHGKGFGHTALAAGSPIPPPNPTGHAWNAVKIDNGEWKLIDPCWGAGNVSGKNMPYNKDFTPAQFIMDNNEFGTRHFPEDRSKQFRTDGRVLTWEEYLMDDMGERLQVYSDVKKHGIGERTFEPRLKHIRVRDATGPDTIRFTFAAVCQHYDLLRCTGDRPCVMLLKVGGRDGRKDDLIPFECTGVVGSVWWVDVRRDELGAPGQTVSIFAVTSFDNGDGRGVSVDEFKRKKGRVAMGFAGIAAYDLV